MADGRITGRGWQNPRPLPADSAARAARFTRRRPEFEDWREPEQRGGRLESQERRSPPVYLVRELPDPDDDDALDPLDSSASWAETTGRALRERPPLPVPELPDWVPARAAEKLRRVLAVHQIPLASPKVTAGRVRRLAERLASGYRDNDRRLKRPQMADDRAHALLRGLLGLADEVEGINRSDEDRISARREDVKVEPRSNRRAEVLKLYASMLETRGCLTRDQRISLDVARLFTEASRCPVYSIPRVRWWWQPPGKIATFNKATSRTCTETPGAACAYTGRGQAVSRVASAAASPSAFS